MASDEPKNRNRANSHFPSNDYHNSTHDHDKTPNSTLEDASHAESMCGFDVESNFAEEFQKSASCWLGSAKKARIAQKLGVSKRSKAIDKTKDKKGVAKQALNLKKGIK